MSDARRASEEALERWDRYDSGFRERGGKHEGMSRACARSLATALRALVAERGHDGQPCTVERPCCVCDQRDSALRDLSRAVGALREIDAKIGHFADMKVTEFPHALVPLVARTVKAVLAEVGK